MRTVSRRRREHQLYVSRSEIISAVVQELCLMAMHVMCAFSNLVMMYTRASASDYDDWETVYQNPGWGSKDLIPLLRKVRMVVLCPTRVHLFP
jgi:GMC oxidoreductase